MCGIAGIYCFNQESVSIAKTLDHFSDGNDNLPQNAHNFKQKGREAFLLKAMTDAIKHRGPDDEG
ncbi:MAG: hypothetical protein ABFC98_03635, partial [Candidatus Cloacimonas sp.]